jgi:alkylhydroperoxidase family enzyme
MMRGTGLAPLSLFRTFLRNPAMVDAMGPWGAHTLGPGSTLDDRTREIVIERVCVRCGCEYEWGVHVAVFAPGAGLAPADVSAIQSAAPAAPLTERDRLVVRLVDELHDTARVADSLWRQVEVVWSGEQLLDLVALAGWYHAISYLANAAGLAPEPWAPRFGTESS